MNLSISRAKQNAIFLIYWICIFFPVFSNSIYFLSFLTALLLILIFPKLGNSSLNRFLFYSSIWFFIAFIAIVGFSDTLPYGNIAVGLLSMNLLSYFLFFPFEFGLKDYRYAQITVFIFTISVLILQYFIIYQNPSLIARLNFVECSTLICRFAGNTSYIYCVTLLLQYFFLIYLKKNNFFLSFLILALGVIYCIASTKFIALSSWAVVVSFYSIKRLYYNLPPMVKSLRLKRSIMYLSVSIFSLSVLCILYVIQTGLDQFDHMTNRINGLWDLLFNGAALVDSTFRVKLYIMSINTFFDSIPNFIFGKGPIYLRLSDLPELNEYYLMGIGHHSTILDTLSRYGILGAGAMSVFVYHIFKVTKSIPEIFMSFIFYSLFNNSSFIDIMFALGLIIYMQRAQIYLRRQRSEVV